MQRDPDDLLQSHEIDTWHEGIGKVLWWRVSERWWADWWLPKERSESPEDAPYIGTPEDAGWPFGQDDKRRLVWTHLPRSIKLPVDA